VSDQPFDVISAVGGVGDQDIVLYRPIPGGVAPYGVAVLPPIVHIGEAKVIQVPFDLPVAVVGIVDGQWILLPIT
jgi:hypothetical protein